MTGAIATCTRGVVDDDLGGSPVAATRRAASRCAGSSSGSKGCAGFLAATRKRRVEMGQDSNGGHVFRTSVRCRPRRPVGGGTPRSGREGDDGATSVADGAWATGRGRAVSASTAMDLLVVCAADSVAAGGCC